MSNDSIKKGGFVTAFAPASVGNVAVGFDMLGLALKGVGDRVSVRRRRKTGIEILEVRTQDGLPHLDLSTRPDQNTASIAAAAMWRASGERGGLELIVDKGIPLQSGMGGSAASAVAAVTAINGLLGNRFDSDALLLFALEGEKYASGQFHADNVAASLLGGLQFCPMALLPLTVRISPPSGISCVLMHPDLKIDTAEGRRKLTNSCTTKQWLTQQGYLAAFILGCERNDHQLISASIRDVIIEPQRAASVPCFVGVKKAALAAGAMGCSLSGSGPSIFALCADELACDVASAMCEACHAANLRCDSWTSSMNTSGACLE